MRKDKKTARGRALRAERYDDQKQTAEVSWRSRRVELRQMRRLTRAILRRKAAQIKLHVARARVERTLLGAPSARDAICGSTPRSAAVQDTGGPDKYRGERRGKHVHELPPEGNAAAAARVARGLERQRGRRRQAAASHKRGVDPL